MRTGVSVIIPTLNRADSLAETLRSLAEQGFPPSEYELIVVDNGSIDGTREVVERAISAHPDRRIRFVHEPVPGLLAGRHRGASEAEAELLAFVDDDITASPGWLAAVVRTFGDPTVQLVGGRNLPSYEIPPPPWLDAFWQPTPYGGNMCTWLSFLDLGEAELDVDPVFVWGLNLAIRRRALVEAGGFHPDNIQPDLQRWQGDGETGLCVRIRDKGWRAVYQPDALVHHRTPASRLTVQYFERRARYQGVCDSYAQIRANEGLEPRREVGWRTFRAVAVWVIRGSRTLAATVRSPQVGAVQRRVRAAYRAGYDFHQAAARDDPEVLSWVLRSEYWDYRIPERPTTDPDR